MCRASGRTASASLSVASDRTSAADPMRFRPTTMMDGRTSWRNVWATHATITMTECVDRAAGTLTRAVTANA